MTVTANSMEIAGAATSHQCVAAMPDVCLSPPPPPAGPVPIPYPNTSRSADLKDGSKDVELEGKAITLENKSHYATSPLGDEASTKSFGANVVDHVNAGKTFVQAHSSNVLVEKKGVTRTGDLTTSNHASNQPGGGAMTPQLAGGGGAGSGEGGDQDDPNRCPCCKGPLHENQKDANNRPLKKTTRANYYQQKRQVVEEKARRYPEWARANPDRVNESKTLKFGSSLFREFTGKRAEVVAEELRRAVTMHEQLTALMAANPDCPNLHKTDDGCGTHFEGVPPGAAKATRKKEFKDKVRNAANARAAAKLGRPVPDSATVHHKTPLEAGGCPTAQDNLVSDAELSGDCKTIETLQTDLQGRS